MRTANRLNDISEYIFSRLAEEVKKVETKTVRKVLNFGQGSPDFKPSKKYMKKLHEFYDEKNSHLYPGYKAIPELSNAIIYWYKNKYHVDVTENEILPLLGAKDGVSHLPLALLDNGDEILIPDPGYPAYYDPAVLFGAKPVAYDLLEKNDFALDLKNIQKKITSKTKAIWVNFPSNPTGQVADLETLEELVAFAKEHNVFILYDNAYAEIAFDGFTAPSILQVKDAKDIAVELCSYSKTFSFAGFRMGWIVGNKEVIAALAKVKSQMDSGLSLPLQKLGAYVLTDFDHDWHIQMIQSYQQRRDSIAKYITRLGLSFQIPKGSLYIWAKIPAAEKNSEKFSMKLLAEKQILLTPGTAFGENGERFVRVSICVNIDKIDLYF